MAQIRRWRWLWHASVVFSVRDREQNMQLPSSLSPSPSLSAPVVFSLKRETTSRMCNSSLSLWPFSLLSYTTHRWFVVARRKNPTTSTTVHLSPLTPPFSLLSHTTDPSNVVIPYRQRALLFLISLAFHHLYGHI